MITKRKNLILATLSALSIITSPIGATAGTNDDIIAAVLDYMPGTTAFAKPRVEKLNVNDNTKTVNLELTESASYIPLTAKQLTQLKAQVLDIIGKPANYKVKITAAGRSLDDLAIYADKRYVKPKEKAPFVQYAEKPEAPKGLDGSHIALWQSHGLYYQGHDTWGWQRPRLFTTCEDLFTQSFVMPFLMPMLENAGAYVMSPRERDTSTYEYIIDNDDSHAAYAERNGRNQWTDATKPGFGHIDPSVPLTENVNPFAEGTVRQVKGVKSAKDASAVSWNAEIDRDGEYAVYVSYQSLPNSTTAAEYTINTDNGPRHVTVNQRMGGGTWIYLGHYGLSRGLSDKPIVELTNITPDGGIVTADAVKIGGGMGNVARRPATVADDGVEYDYMVSGYPRFTEGARYWLQWAGAPDSVYTPSANTQEYNDDYRSRGYWVNWLTGGSSVLPDAEGLHIPVDLAFAFHSDAGITLNDSIIGTLGIYYTDNKDSYANGTSRLAARDLVNSVMTNIVDDVRASYEPNWTRRGMWDRNYAEARVPEVPTMLLELLSHQNFADMRYGLDPTFRFTVSRAIYKGMLKFLAHRDGRDYVVQPLPVNSFAITGGEEGRYRLTWAETVDTLESTATPTYYIIETRPQGAVAFSEVARVNTPEYDIVVNDNSIHSYRVIAANDGGYSFPSEVLALCYRPSKPQVTIVNGFTRVSAPDSYDYGEAAGFDDNLDPGVPYIQDISKVGSQFEFRRNISWMANEVAGLGASRSDYEDQVIAGNTFDFVVTHGQAIVDGSECGFVSSSVAAFAAAQNQPAIVDLIFGNQKETGVGTAKYGTKYKTFTPELQQRLTTLANAGTNIMVSGSYIATDLWCNPYSTEEVAEADQDFATKVLGYTWRSGRATEYDKVRSVKSRYSIFQGFNFTFNNTLNADSYAVTSPGAIAPADDHGAIVMQYTDGELPAVTAFDNGHRVVAMGFPFEAITSRDVRVQLMRSILTFFK